MHSFDHNAFDNVADGLHELCWEGFARMAPEERQAALGHSLEISVSSMAHGWQDVEIAIDGRKMWCHISSAIGSSYDDFAQAVADMGICDSLSFTWAQEPGSCTWHISRLCDVVHVNAPVSKTGSVPAVYLRWDDFLDAVNPSLRDEMLLCQSSWHDEKALSWGERIDDDSRELAFSTQFDLLRVPKGLGWHGELWEELLINVAGKSYSYCDCGFDELVEAIDGLADGQDLIFRHGQKPGGLHDWFCSRRGDLAIIDNPVFDIGWDLVSYQAIRDAFNKS
jgi:hypothetical protein